MENYIRCRGADRRSPEAKETGDGQNWQGCSRSIGMLRNILTLPQYQNMIRPNTSMDQLQRFPRLPKHTTGQQTRQEPLRFFLMSLPSNTNSWRRPGYSISQPWTPWGYHRPTSPRSMGTRYNTGSSGEHLKIPSWRRRSLEETS